jgi:hypothetical protein
VDVRIEEDSKEVVRECDCNEVMEMENSMEMVRKAWIHKGRRKL